MWHSGIPEWDNGAIPAALLAGACLILFFWVIW